MILPWENEVCCQGEKSSKTPPIIRRTTKKAINLILKGVATIARLGD
jgi:hypothetical protein